MADPIDMNEADKLEVSIQVSGNMTMNGEAWKERGNTTYTSLLDIYGVPKLFSQNSTDSYNKLNQQKSLEYQGLTEYIFSDKIQETDEENLIEQIFSEEIQFSRVRDYNKKEENYLICFIMAEILFVLISVSIFMKINAIRRKRGKRRELNG